MNAYSVLHSCKLALLFLLSLLLETQCIFIPYAPCDDDPLEPCRNHPSLPGSIICENIQDIRTFVRVIRCNRKNNMQEVFLVESKIDYLPLYILDFCGFSLLHLQTVTINTFPETSDMIGLEQLHLDNVTINSPWNWEPLGELTKLIKFSVSNMVIELLDGSLVDHLNWNLESLILTSTNTAQIAYGALQKFENLIYISIQNNEIQYLRRSMFPRPSKIKYFYFGKNKITTLPEDIFQDMPDLEIVVLQDNLISELHELTFRRIWNQLSYVFVEGNPLKCYCKMLWLSKRKTPSIFHGKCYAPKTHFGKELKDLKLSDFQCY